MELIHCATVADKTPRKGSNPDGAYRTINISKGYDSPYMGLMVAEVYDNLEEFTSEQLDAYHRLLVNAPDLLEAAQDVINSVGQYRQGAIVNLNEAIQRATT